ncbi:MAG: hypothetical protein UV78_C0050G0010 [Parcubacteria group bacterium GW2011_GWA2_43_17]|nr:MAG: hypothetical protein UV78_C0050G0010 [Parcubacteria group bacterium GW2011_GWA2_43_17]KKT90724.1 MAG: hypothetical protein UW91_C0049G0004 [Parcubacteria group bacterium GW2011_GWF2_45_11]
MGTKVNETLTDKMSVALSAVYLYHCWWHRHLCLWVLLEVKGGVKVKCG